MAAYIIPEGIKTLTVTIATSGNGKDFAKRVANAKRFQGKFDGAAKTWTINTQTITGRNLAEFGFVLAGNSAPAANVCQGCHDPKCRDGECGFGVDYREVR